jgi:hypothetical protein
MAPWVDASRRVVVTDLVTTSSAGTARLTCQLPSPQPAGACRPGTSVRPTGSPPSPRSFRTRLWLVGCLLDSGEIPVAFVSGFPNRTDSIDVTQLDLNTHSILVH